MKTVRFIILIWVTTSFSVKAQALRDINYSYEYDSEKPFSFDIQPIRQGSAWTIFYKLHVLNSTDSLNDFSIQWEIRESTADKTGTPLTTTATPVSTSSKEIKEGKLNLNVSNSPQLLVAKVINTKTKTLWLLYKVLDPDYTVTAYLQSQQDEIIFDPFITKSQSVSVHGFNEWPILIVSYYNHRFPTAAPAFSEGLARVNQIIKPDSIYTIGNGDNVHFTKQGLYLIQKDTTTTEGICFRVEEDGYPKFNHLKDLVGPFVFVCTKDEYDNLRVSANDKKLFDRGVLNITRDADRARDFMRNYFQRAEAANRLFTSYKEGWKTDRGMLYIIYGPPKTVFKFTDREVWTYGKTNFSFVKSATLFDPENFVLIRDQKYAEEWYEKVDLIRNSRF